MRKLFVPLLLTIVFAAACSSDGNSPSGSDSPSETSASQSTSPDSSSTSDSESETGTSESHSSSSGSTHTLDSETESQSAASSQPSSSKTEEHLDIFNHPLDGLPDCSLDDFKVSDAGNSEVFPEIRITDNKGITYTWETQFIIGQNTGHGCVFREPISMRFENSQGETQWPVFAKTIVDYELPWAIDDDEGIKLFYQEDKGLYPCNADDVPVDTVVLTTKSQGSIRYHMGYGLYVCPYKVEGYHSDLHMVYVQ